MIEVFGKRAFALILAILLAVPALSLPRCGATHVFKLIAIVLALELIGGRDELAVIYREKWYAAVLSVDVDSARRAVAFGTEHGAHIAALDTKVVVNPVDLARCRSIAVGDDGVLTVIGGRPDAEYAPRARRVKTWNLPENALIGPVMIGTIELATEALY